MPTSQCFTDDSMALNQEGLVYLKGGPCHLFALGYFGCVIRHFHGSVRTIGLPICCWGPMRCGVTFRKVGVQTLFCIWTSHVAQIHRNGSWDLVGSTRPRIVTTMFLATTLFFLALHFWWFRWRTASPSFHEQVRISLDIMFSRIPLLVVNVGGIDVPIIHGIPERTSFCKGSAIPGSLSFPFSSPVVCSLYNVTGFPPTVLLVPPLLPLRLPFLILHDRSVVFWQSLFIVKACSLLRQAPWTCSGLFAVGI